METPLFEPPVELRRWRSLLLLPRLKRRCKRGFSFGFDEEWREVWREFDEL